MPRIHGNLHALAVPTPLLWMMLLAACHPSGTLEVHVHGDQAFDAVGAATVAVEGAGGTVWEAHTGPDGSATFTGLDPQGLYAVTVDPDDAVAVMITNLGVPGDGSWDIWYPDEPTHDRITLQGTVTGRDASRNFTISAEARGGTVMNQPANSDHYSVQVPPGQPFSLLAWEYESSGEWPTFHQAFYKATLVDEAALAGDAVADIPLGDPDHAVATETGSDQVLLPDDPGAALHDRTGMYEEAMAASPAGHLLNVVGVPTTWSFASDAWDVDMWWAPLPDTDTVFAASIAQGTSSSVIFRADTPDEWGTDAKLLTIPAVADGYTPLHHDVQFESYAETDAYPVLLLRQSDWTIRWAVFGERGATSVAVPSAPSSEDTAWLESPSARIQPALFRRGQAAQALGSDEVMDYATGPMFTIVH